MGPVRRKRYIGVPGASERVDHEREQCHVVVQDVADYRVSKNLGTDFGITLVAAAQLPALADKIC